jgi:ferric iron reductase protein FhuF
MSSQALGSPQAVSYLPYFAVSALAGLVLLYLLGGLAQWWSLHAWRVGIKAAVQKQKAAIIARRTITQGEKAHDPKWDYPETRQGPPRWVCKRCGKARRRSGCLSCGNKAPLSDERPCSGLIR